MVSTQNEIQPAPPGGVGNASEDFGPCIHCGASPGVVKVDYYPLIEDSSTPMGFRIDKTTPWKTVVLCQECANKPAN